MEICFIGRFRTDDKIDIKSEQIMERLYIWHNTRVHADEYFVCYGDKVLFGLPKIIGRILPHIG